MHKLPTVGLLSTGNELQAPSESDGERPLRPGAIRDSNKSTLSALLREEGVPRVDCGIARDDGDDLARGLERALGGSDLLVTTGGVSMGDRDIMRQVLQDRFGAKIHFARWEVMTAGVSFSAARGSVWSPVPSSFFPCRVHMKPGKPTTFATLTWKDSPKLVLGLPGNPVSAAVTANLYVLPACRKMAGRRDVMPAIVR